MWHATNPNFINEVNSEIINNKKLFVVSKFMKKFYENKRKGTGYVSGTLEERAELDKQGKGYLMSLVNQSDNLTIMRNKIFYTAPVELRNKRTFLNNCHKIQNYNLTPTDYEQLDKIFPNFSLNFFNVWKRKINSTVDLWDKGDIIPFPNTAYQKAAMPTLHIYKAFVSPILRYKLWLGTDYEIFDTNFITKLPRPLHLAELLFDKNVIPIKRLVKNISDLNKIIEREQEKFFLYNDSDIITHTFFTEVNKKIPCFSLISLEYNSNNERLIAPKSSLKFNMQYQTLKENITLQLQSILNPKKIETVDSKIKNFSILVTEKKNLIGSKRKMQRRITDEFKIEGLQNFVNYSKIDPINIQINDSEIQNALAFYSSRYKYRFIANNLLFRSSIQQDTNVIFLTTNGLNDTKDILINRKIVKGIGVIYLSEISRWEKIFKNITLC